MSSDKRMIKWIMMHPYDIMWLLKYFLEVFAMNSGNAHVIILYYYKYYIYINIIILSEMAEY